MDETALKVAIAAFIHDICFIKKIRQFFPSYIDDSFINSEEKIREIIHQAEGLSRGKKDNNEVLSDCYHQTRLLTLFEQLLDEQFDKPEKFTYSYPLKPLSPGNIFPELKQEIMDKETDEQYKMLFDDFIEGLRNLKHKDSNLELWFEHFESLMMIYTSCIPSPRAGKVLPDVSLYDHSKATAALAVAIYLYHHKNNSLDIPAIQSYEDKKFLIVSGNFYGIQDFIFKGYGDTRKYRSKILRGRSFAVSLLSELAADKICRKFGLPCTSVILNAAGNFTIIAPNLQNARKDIQDIENEINNWLIKISYGETLIGISCIEAGGRDFVSGKFTELWEKKGQKNEEKKFSRVDLNQFGVKEYKTEDKLKPPICSICGKRPANKSATDSSYLRENQEEDKSSCRLCRDHIFLGANLVKKERVAITLSDTSSVKKEDKLSEPIFGEYQVIFEHAEKITENLNLRKYWSLGIDDGFKGIAVKFIKGYVPKYSDEDWLDKRIYESLKNEKEKTFFKEQIKDEDPKSLNHIACKAKNFTEDKDKFCGLEAVAVLKADVDSLGKIMACGIKPETRFTLSRLAQLSRQLNFYFAVYLPHILKTYKEFQDVYTVFAGGDDLFLIGPWNKIIDLVSELHKSFADYVCKNKEVHFSAGITLHKAHTTISFMAETAEHALEQSKSKGKNEDGTKGRNRLTLFSETVTWDELEKLIEIEEKLLIWYKNRVINNAMLYRLNTLMQMAEQANRVMEKRPEITLEDMLCFKWRGYLAYTVARNVAKNEKDEKKKSEQIKMIHEHFGTWLKDYGAKMKIPVWSILYDNRKS